MGFVDWIVCIGIGNLFRGIVEHCKGTLTQQDADEIIPRITPLTKIQDSSTKQAVSEMMLLLIDAGECI